MALQQILLLKRVYISPESMHNADPMMVTVTEVLSTGQGSQWLNQSHMSEGKSFPLQDKRLALRHLTSLSN